MRLQGYYQRAGREHRKESLRANEPKHSAPTSMSAPHAAPAQIHVLGAGLLQDVDPYQACPNLLSRTKTLAFICRGAGSRTKIYNPKPIFSQKGQWPGGLGRSGKRRQMSIRCLFLRALSGARDCRLREARLPLPSSGERRTRQFLGSNFGSTDTCPRR